MKSLYEWIREMHIEKWYYYYEIDNYFEPAKPFIDNLNYAEFILNYFRRGGKVKIFESCGIRMEELRLPNHICSVFFLGILLYNQTSFHKKYKLGNNDPGYATFPFIWFLIALFHDNAYQMEETISLKKIDTIEDLLRHFNINYSLLDTKFSKCKKLLECRSNYFIYRKEKWQMVDHGILGGMLLFDRLVKIRTEKRKQNEETLFWGKKLEKQYRIAGNAISIHNIWLPSKEKRKEYKDYGLSKLLKFKPVKFAEFPLFYILGVVDTIEPLKTYKDDKFSDTTILKSLLFEFGKNNLRISNRKNSKLNFKKLVDKTKYFQNWLDIDVITNESSIELTFR